jgi:Asp/Glu/hydantoin racemase
VSARSLTPEHLKAAGVDSETPVMGTDDGREFTRALIGNRLELDVAAAEQDILEAGSALKKRHPDLGAVVLECTNMAPYARALSEHLQLPVFDIVGFISWFQSGLRPRDFGPPGSAPRVWRER